MMRVEEVRKNPIKFTDLVWEANPPRQGKPAYDETDISIYFADLIDWGNYGDTLIVTIRRYPQRYFVAYQLYSPDDPGNVFDYTQDGEGDGLIPLTVVTICQKVPRREFEQGFDTYMLMLRDQLQKATSSF